MNDAELQGVATRLRLSDRATDILTYRCAGHSAAEISWIMDMDEGRVLLVLSGVAARVERLRRRDPEREWWQTVLRLVKGPAPSSPPTPRFAASRYDERLRQVRVRSPFPSFWDFIRRG